MAVYYAVQKGRKPGIYTTWDQCRQQVTGFPGAVYKKFTIKEDAERFANSHAGYGSLQASSVKTPRNGKAKAVSSGPVFHSLSEIKKEDIVNEMECVDTEALAYVDGSFMAATKVYGYGGILMCRDGSFHIFQGHGTDPELASMRNVSGEIYGSMAAVNTAAKLGMTSLTIFYDYMGIEMWADGQWKTNKEGTKKYAAFIKEMRQKMDIRFVKVEAHTGVRFNELVDQFAKASVGNETILKE